MAELNLTAPAPAGVTPAPRAALEAMFVAGAEDYIDVVLEGGPAELPAEERNRRERIHEDRIKVPYYGGHEHFERVDVQQHPVVYRWITRTRMAE